MWGWLLLSISIMVGEVGERDCQTNLPRNIEEMCIAITVRHHHSESHWKILPSENREQLSTTILLSQRFFVKKPNCGWISLANNVRVARSKG